MRKVIIPKVLWRHLAELHDYLVYELKLSEKAANARIGRIESRVMSLGLNADYALCRFTRWRRLGYRCLSFEGWVFAYEVFPGGVIIRDMSHGKLLPDATD